MPRKSRSPGPARTQAPRRSASIQRSAPAASATAPAHHAPPSQNVAPNASMGVSQPKQPGLFAQMATTAAGVAVGSAVGHTLGAGITSVLSGGSNSAQHQSESIPQAQSNSYGAPLFTPDTDADRLNTPKCDADVKAYLKCMESNNNEPTPCSYYLEVLKQCQSRSF